MLDVESDSVIIHTKRDIIAMLDPHEYRELRDIIRSYDWYIDGKLTETLPEEGA